ncbi:MAG: hypothetical protein ACRDZV_00375 [Acidimicrobiia bacterium]
MTYSDTEIAEAVGAPITPFTPEKGALSTLFRWFAPPDGMGRRGVATALGLDAAEVSDWDADHLLAALSATS